MAPVLMPFEKPSPLLLLRSSEKRYTAYAILFPHAAVFYARVDCAERRIPALSNEALLLG